MVAIELLRVLLSMMGRYKNKKIHKPENTNAWLFMAQYVDMAGAMFYLIFSLHLCNIF